MSTRKTIQSALISVFDKTGLEPIVRQLHKQNAIIYSTGGTEDFIKNLGIPVVPVEDVTSYPSILGGRVKTLHPKVFGGILNRQDNPTDVEQMKEFEIPQIDLVIVDLYPFEETLRNTTEEKLIIEQIDIGGPSMIRAAAKNHKDVVVLVNPDDYVDFMGMYEISSDIDDHQRLRFAQKVFAHTSKYDDMISQYLYHQIFAI